MARGLKNARYEVTDVWGFMVGKVSIGDILVDTYRGRERTWNFLSPTDEGGMTGRFIGRRANAHNDDGDVCRCLDGRR